MKKARFVALIIISTIMVALIVVVLLVSLAPAKEKTSTTPGAEQPEPSFVEKEIAGMSLSEKISGLLLLHVSGTDSTKMADFLAKYRPAGLIFMGDNTNLPDSELSALISSLQTNPDLPYLISVDEEGGPVTRLKSDSFPAANALKSQDPATTESAFASRTSLLASLGFNLNFGIIADYTPDRSSFIYSRTFGTSPTSAGERVSAAVKGTTAGTLSTLKHFPGHGATSGDSHVSVPTVANLSKAEWLQKDAVPFAEGVTAGADAVMFGHLAYTAVDPAPASLSPAWHKILREDLSFDGLIVTDDMVMLLADANYIDNTKNAIDALNAGNDLLLFVTDHGGGASNFDIDALIGSLTTAAASGQIKETTIDAALRRVLTARHSLAGR